MIIYSCHVNPYTVEKRVEHREQRRFESNKKMRRERTDHDSTIDIKYKRLWNDDENEDGM